MAVIFERVGKRYGGRTVLSGLDWRLEPGERWLIKGASGVGKTTLLRLLVGLERPDEGRISGAEKLRFSMCFQENRLCEQMNGVMNLAMVCGQLKPEQIRKLLKRLLPEEAIERPAGTLSGGMARRVALARALAAPSEVVVLDEPFAGLDADSRENALEFIEAQLGERALVLVSHEPVELADAKVLRLNTEGVL